MTRTALLGALVLASCAPRESTPTGSTIVLPPPITVAVGTASSHHPDLVPLDDEDRDGVRNDHDLCPTEPEDIDGFEDEDGCPDLDNDHDRIPDASDKCPNEPETYNGIDDDDGCPDKSVLIITP